MRPAAEKMVGQNISTQFCQVRPALITILPRLDYCNRRKIPTWRRCNKSVDIRICNKPIRICKKMIQTLILISLGSHQKISLCPNNVSCRQTFTLSFLQFFLTWMIFDLFLCFSGKSSPSFIWKIGIFHNSDWPSLDCHWGWGVQGRSWPHRSSKFSDFFCNLHKSEEIFLSQF